MYIIPIILIFSIPFIVAFFLARLVYRRTVTSANDPAAVAWTVLAFLGSLAVTGFITLILLVMTSGIHC